MPIPPDDSSQESADFDAHPEEGLSLEELSQSYAEVLENEHPTPSNQDSIAEPELEIFDGETDDDDRSCPVTPLSILEAVLLLGHPEGKSVSAEEIASLMRGVSPAEIHDLAAQLNATYKTSGRALRVAEDSVGFHITLTDDVAFIRQRFYGEVRQVSLNQDAIDCLALVAYQPGISRQELENQRSRPSGPVLNQLVRRQLIEMRRDGQAKKSMAHYYPTPKLLELAGLASLDDLPQVEEFQ